MITKEKIKAHFRRNKTRYAMIAIGIVCTAIGLGTGVYIHKRSIKTDIRELENDFGYNKALNAYVEIGAGLIDTINKSVESGAEESYILTHMHNNFIYDTKVNVRSECLGD